jgi:signal transduction histidine kinase
MEMLTSNHNSQHGLLFHIGKQFLRFRWYLILGLGLFVLFFEGFELFEHPDAPPFSDPHIRLELLIYMLIIIIVAFLTEIYVRLLTMHSHALDVLNLKHILSQDLTKTKEWDEVCHLVCQKMGEFGPFDEVQLFTYEKESAAYQSAASWQASWLEGSLPKELSPYLAHACRHTEGNHSGSLKPCDCSMRLSSLNTEGSYCLPIYDHLTPVAKLYFHLSPGIKLTKERSDLLENTRDEIAIALTTARLKHEHAEMKVANATEELRRMISQDLHDTIGQNLCYMRMKLDQFSQPQIQKEFTRVQPELELMRDLANESYGLVRGMLVTMSPGDSMQLINLLEYHARLVSDRTGIRIDISHHGQPHKLHPTTVHHIYFIFREALNNIERHAQAKNVTIIILWGEEELQIEIKDNGIGFDPDHQPELGHYGLNIMGERAKSLGGRLDLLSSADKGTHLSLWLPLAA